MTTQDLTSTVVSRDGTMIAVDRYGSGPAIVLAGGAFTDRRALAPFAQALAPYFTVLAYDRRGDVGAAIQAARLRLALPAEASHRDMLHAQLRAIQARLN